MRRVLLSLAVVVGPGCVGVVDDVGDWGREDSGTVGDGGFVDGGLVDAGQLDAGGVIDAGRPDDGGVVDAGQPDDGGVIDAGQQSDACVMMSVFRDADGDGVGGAMVRLACDLPAGWVTRQGDCDDGDAQVLPGGALRVGTDSNCDGFVDFDVNGDRQSDLSPPGLTFDPATQRHVELPEVAAGVPFRAELHDGRYAPEGTNVLTPAFASQLTWSAVRRAFEGQVRDPGVYRFAISVCTRVPWDAAACALAQNRRTDLVHLTVRGGPRGSPQEPPARGSFATSQSRVEVDVTGVLRQLDIDWLPNIAAAEPDPARRPDFLGLGTVSPTRLITPTSAGSVAPGAFPLVVLLHGNGYHWDDYDELGELLASHGLIVVVPQFPNGFLGACGGGPSTQQRVQFGMRAVSWALGQSSMSGTALSGRLDPTKVVVIGHSWGGAAAEWSMPVIGARAFVIFDPISLLNNVREWRMCNTNLFDPAAGTDHLDRDYRDTSAPVLLLDSGRSGFTGTLAEYRGFHVSAPLVHVSVQNAMHEDFLDASEAARWLPPGTCYDQGRLDAFHAESARWLMRFVRRYVNDDVKEDTRVHGFEAFTAPGSLSTRVATFRPAADARLVETAARLPLGSFSSAANLVGGVTTLDGPDAGVGLTLAAGAMARLLSDGGRDLFSQATADYLESAAHPEYRHFTTTQGTLPVRLESTFVPPFAADAYRALCVDALVEGPTMARCRPDAGDDPLESFTLTFAFTLIDGGVSQRAVPSTASHHVPQTLCAPLAGLPQQPVSSVRLELPPGTQPRGVAFTDLRFVY